MDFFLKESGRFLKGSELILKESAQFLQESEHSLEELGRFLQGSDFFLKEIQCFHRQPPRGEGCAILKGGSGVPPLALEGKRRNAASILHRIYLSSDFARFQ